jgi:hypothetical protein
MMAIRAVQDYDASFKLSEECSQTLTAYMRHPDMEQEVCKQYGVQKAEFEEGRLFQPVPYSSNTPHGMPLDYEQFHLNDDVSLETCFHEIFGRLKLQHSKIVFAHAYRLRSVSVHQLVGAALT